MNMTELHKLFNAQTQEIEVSLIRQFDEKVAGIDNMIRLTLGQPDFPTPQHVKEAGIEAINNNFSFYTGMAGDIRLRKAMANFVKVKYNVSYDPETEILSTVGATEALASSLLGILNPGDKVLIPSPFFSLYEPLVTLGHGKAVFIDTTKNDFILSPKMIESAMEEHGDKVKAIILNYPTNPTGVTWNREEVQAIANTIKKYPNVFAISDEIYSELVYEGSHISLGEYLFDQTIVINGLSKSHAMTGWRLGFTLAPKDITDQIKKVHQNLVTSASSITQYAGIEALKNGMDDAVPMRLEYRKRRDLIYEVMSDLGFKIAKPNGAFYIFARIPDGYIQNSFSFCYDLAQKAKIGFIPGVAFGKAGEGYVRLSYASSMSEIKEAMERLTTYMKENAPEI
ncbi:aspartate aminotransferase [Marinilactibacillus psychrotolerans]|uniref:Aminotransferase n=3 Tax=Marinilactibacillus psychrotolerans TaxID=191770 RepID=A0AAV3WPA1_9LACT|nr:aminotransferase [Marinilactibacillus psychrotolerans]GEQ33112.1 aspartate aminotransferase [Marinilactibacillus psychrotolerans]GEQ34565.1 aspartate aminotransferase [Marinilactibacillus psychrotolerans]SDB99626.1 aminotransferase [Marinilactibacillus psychrotolerans]SJN21568.1 Aspartate aminotransferase [Marinilactibacillus psychrotolerans 42ea]